MSAQSSDPRSLLYPKPGWSEPTGPHSFRIRFSHEEVRLVTLLTARPEQGAYLHLMGQMLDRDIREANKALKRMFEVKTTQRAAHGYYGRSIAEPDP